MTAVIFRENPFSRLLPLIASRLLLIVETRLTSSSFFLSFHGAKAKNGCIFVANREESQEWKE